MLTSLMILVFDVGGHEANFAFEGGVGDREFPSRAKLSFLSGGSIFAHVFPSLIQQCISQGVGLSIHPLILSLTHLFHSAILPRIHPCRHQCGLATGSHRSPSIRRPIHSFIRSRAALETALEAARKY